MYHLPIPPERNGMELDEFLCLSFPLLTKGFLRRQVRDGKILIDGQRTTPGQRLRPSDVILIDFDEDEVTPEVPVAPAFDVPVLFEDEHVLAVDKPADLAAEPERWARGNASLSGAVLSIALERAEADVEGPLTPMQGLEFRPRLLHRLDKDTTGVVLVAKTVEAERRLRPAFEDGSIQKSYLALVEGEYPLPDGESEIIDLPIGPDERKSGRMRIDRVAGKPSRTRVSVEKRFTGYTLMRCEPLTGRTHQIRVHMREVGFPLVVDPVYGRHKSLSLSEFKTDYKKKRGHVESPLISRLTLHAQRITFPRVAPGVAGATETITVESPIPQDFGRVLKQMTKVRAR